MTAGEVDRIERRGLPGPGLCRAAEAAAAHAVRLALVAPQRRQLAMEGASQCGIFAAMPVSLELDGVELLVPLVLLFEPALQHEHRYAGLGAQFGDGQADRAAADDREVGFKNLAYFER